MNYVDVVLVASMFIPPFIWWGIFDHYFSRMWVKSLYSVPQEHRSKKFYLIENINDTMESEGHLSKLTFLVSVIIPLACIPLFRNHPTIPHYAFLFCFFLNSVTLASHFFTFIKLIFLRFVFNFECEDC